MSEPCPVCETTMYVADDYNCEKADWVCPECAPEFVLRRATSETEDPPEWGEM